MRDAPCHNGGFFLNLYLKLVATRHVCRHLKHPGRIAKSAEVPVDFGCGILKHCLVLSLKGFAGAEWVHIGIREVGNNDFGDHLVERRQHLQSLFLIKQQ